LNRKRLCEGKSGRYDAVFFDFDGVILESSDIKLEAFRALYREYGSEVAEAACAHHKALGGMSRRKKIRHCHARLLGITLSKPELDWLARRFSGLVEDAMVACAWVPGAEALLDRVRNRDCLAMFVVSAAPESELRSVVERRGLGRYFLAVRGAPTEKVSIIRALLDEHDVLPSRALFVGDATGDRDAAGATGLAFVGRVAVGEASPFPPGTQVVSDLTRLKL
jgi:phosphoglycolate phosphatase-like HAD superfamily hydrolase